MSAQESTKVEGASSPAKLNGWVIPAVVALIATLVGAISWGVQLSQGHEVLALGQNIVWGIYIAAFFLLAGAGGGLLILVALGDMEILAGAKKNRRSLLIAALACFIAAGFMILMDLGRPERALSMLVSPNFNSMFIWDFYCLILSVIMSLVLLFTKGSKILAAIAILVAAAIIIAEGFILAVSVGTPLWQTSLIPALFLAEGLIAALAVALLLKESADVDKGLTRFMAAVLCIALVFNVLEVIVTGYMAGTEAAASLQILTSGSMAPLFWCQMLVGIVLPFIIVIWMDKNAIALMVAAILAILGVLIGKVALLVAGQAISQATGAVASYAPSIVEIGGLIGGLGLAVLLFVLGKNFLPGKAKE